MKVPNQSIEQLNIFKEANQPWAEFSNEINGIFHIGLKVVNTF